MLSDPAPVLKLIRAGVLEIGYFEHGPPDGWAVVLSHGFPYDVHAYDEVAPLLSDSRSACHRTSLARSGSFRIVLGLRFLALFVIARPPNRAECMSQSDY